MELPSHLSLVENARLFDSGAKKLNYTVVGADGIWNMNIESVRYLPSDGSSKIYFENNGEINSNVEGQTIGKESGDSERFLNLQILCLSFDLRHLN